MTLPDGPRYYLSPADFYPLRQHYRGELIGAIKAELQRDAVQSIVDLPYATSVQACDCYIRAHSEREFWPEGYPNAQYDDLGDLSHWQLAASATQ
ncbi:MULTISPECIES: hypothetical protein [Ralstonia]|uniref:hypothetical protein n=1 Tax=Ralstonia TaxID=48736 RepID=UPI00117DA36A|nr:hypothetical protein [Ralstonia pickettii]